MMTRTLLAPAVLAGLVLAGCASAQQRPPRPDFGALAAGIGVPEAALTTCLRDLRDSGAKPRDKAERPAAGERPSRPDGSKLAACLTEAGHPVSAETVAEAMRAAAPPPRQ